jgi:putative flavoprotein involved in K+ transport
VGSSNSGCQIAAELSTTRTVDLSVGQRLPAIPQKPLGRDVWTWATALHLDRVSAQSPLGRRLSKRDQIIGAGPRQLSRRHTVQLRPRVTTTAGREVTFADGSASTYDAVLWATGFTHDNTWIDIPEVTDEGGGLRQSRGVTPSPGLYTLGLTWQHTRGSALLGWVGNDAAFLATQIAAMSP